jgi:hypothetical protein
MRPLLMDPAFPDIVGEWAEQQAQDENEADGSANDNQSDPDAQSDTLLALVARAEIEATRLW